MRTVSAPAAAFMVLAGCAVQQASPPLISSTQGTTLVRSGQVTSVGDVATAAASLETRNTRRITVRFDDGDTRTYEVAAEETIRVGETVKVVINNSKVRITRLESAGQKMP